MNNSILHGNNHRTSRVLMMAFLMCLMVSPKLADRACAQIFISDEDYNSSRANVTEDELIPILPQNLEVDWIPTPIGEGWLLMMGFSGAYLLNKKRKRESNCSE